MTRASLLPGTWYETRGYLRSSEILPALPGHLFCRFSSIPCIRLYRFRIRTPHQLRRALGLPRSVRGFKRLSMSSWSLEASAIPPPSIHPMRQATIGFRGLHPRSPPPAKSIAVCCEGSLLVFPLIFELLTCSVLHAPFPAVVRAVEKSPLLSSAAFFSSRVFCAICSFSWRPPALFRMSLCCNSALSCGLSSASSLSPLPTPSLRFKL